MPCHLHTWLRLPRFLEGAPPLPGQLLFSTCWNFPGSCGPLAPRARELLQALSQQRAVAGTSPRVPASTSSQQQAAPFLSTRQVLVLVPLAKAWLNPPATSGAGSYCPHCTVGEAEAQGGEIMWPRSCSWDLDLTPHHEMTVGSVLSVNHCSLVSLACGILCKISVFTFLIKGPQQKVCTSPCWVGGQPESRVQWSGCNKMPRYRGQKAWLFLLQIRTLSPGLFLSYCWALAPGVSLPVTMSLCPVSTTTLCHLLAPAF